MALESLSDTPPPLVSKGNNESDIPANNSLSEVTELEKDSTTEGEKNDPQAAELEDGEIDDDDEEEEAESEEKEESEEELDMEERRRLKKRQKNKERRKRKKEERRMQALQAWAMAMAAGEMGDQGEVVEEDEEVLTEEEEGEPKETAQSKMPERKFSPRKKKQQPRKRQRAQSPSDSDEEYTKLLKKEMSRHRLKRKSSGESSSEDRRGRSPGLYDSGGDAPLRHEEEGSEVEEVETSHRSKKKKRKKHKHHHRTKHSSKKSRREPMESEDEDRMLSHGPPLPPHHHQQQQQQQQQQLYHEQYPEPMSEQDHQIMMDHNMGKVHVPKTHLICKFFLENKCKKGLDCSYTHEGTIPKRPEQCKFYLQGFCSKGPLCMFLHQEYPCKYYHTGQICYSEDKCRFSHAPLTDELKPLVEQMRKELMGPKSRDRDNDQPPLLPSPDKQPNVPFQRGNQGGKPPKGGKSNSGGSNSNNSSIPSLFDIKVKPVGEKGQIILEKERKGLLDFDDGLPSYYGAEQEEHSHGNHSGPSSKRDGSDRPPMGSPRHQGSPQHGHGESSPRPLMKDPPEQGSRPPLLPTPSSPVRPLPSHHEESSTLLKDPRRRRSSDESREATGSSKQAKLEEIATTDDTKDQQKPSVPEGQESTPHAEEESAPSTEKAKPDESSDAAAKPVVEPPKSMPAKSKALFMRIQQNQTKSDEVAEENEAGMSKQQKETDPDDNWYSSDEEEGSKKAQGKGGAGFPQLHIKTETPAKIPAPSAISPEASNRGPLLSSVLIANNKQNEAQNAQTQLPGALASLFSGSQNAQSPSSGAPNSKAAPLPLNILDLVTKGTSSLQKSRKPEVQDLFADILPKKTTQSEYRLLECIRDPNLKDPREGRERRSKAGMMFRVLRWKQSEYSVEEPEDRPSLPPIELTTPTELKPPPAFTSATDARTQAMVDVIKKVISEVRGKPSDPRNQRPADPRMPPQDQMAFLNDPRGVQTNFPPTQPAPMDPRNNTRPQYPMPGQQSPRQQGPPQQRPPGPGFARHPLGQPSQSFPPRLLRPPQQAPTGYSNPRFASRGPRGPRPMRPELGQRMPHRGNRPPLLQPPFASPPRGGNQPHDRMPGPRGPRFGNPRMPVADNPPPVEAPRPEQRDPRAAARAGAMDPRLAKRAAQPAPSSADVDMRVSKDPRLSRMQEQSSFPAGPTSPGFASQGSGDVDMRQLNSPPRASTYKENPMENARSSLDPRQAARTAVNPSNDVDLRPKHLGGDQGGGGEESGMPLKDMFKGRDPTASPFV